MKKVILAAVSLAALAASMNANASTGQTVVCSGQNAGAGAAFADPAVASVTDTFHKAAFTPKCSANVWLTYDDQTTFVRVGSVSGKGKNSFGGSTAGGAVKAYTACASATGCTSAEAATAMSAAATS